jgi:hypothetical protein
MKTYTFEQTTDKKAQRVVDQNGDWTHYFYKPKKLYLRAVNYILNTGFAKGQRFNEFLKNNSKEEIERKLKTTGEKGDKVHQFIRYMFEHKGKAGRYTKMRNDETGKLEMLTSDEWNCILSFTNFWNKHKAVLLAHEFTIFNLEHGFAGTGDAILKITQKCEVKSCPCNKLVGKMGLFDWKSGGGIWDDQGPQIAAYSHGDNLAQKIDYTAILRLGTRHKTTNGYEFEPYETEETENHWQEFLAAIKISNASYRPFDPKKEIYDIPEKVNITITKEKVKAKTKKSK